MKYTVVVIDNAIVVGIYKFYITRFGGWLYFFTVFGICVYFFLTIEISGCRDKPITSNRISGFGFTGSDVLVGRTAFDIRGEKRCVSKFGRSENI